MRYLLDSVIVIDHFNDINGATTFIAEHAAQIALTVITRAEVLTGFEADSEALALDLLDSFPALIITPDTADLAARLRRSHGWKLPDAFQAALAIEHGLCLVTRNSRDFRSTTKLEVLIPYRP